MGWEDSGSTANPLAGMNQKGEHDDEIEQLLLYLEEHPEQVKAWEDNYYNQDATAWNKIEKEDQDAIKAKMGQVQELKDDIEEYRARNYAIGSSAEKDADFWLYVESICLGLQNEWEKHTGDDAYADLVTNMAKADYELQQAIENMAPREELEQKRAQRQQAYDQLNAHDTAYKTLKDDSILAYDLKKFSEEKNKKRLWG